MEAAMFPNLSAQLSGFELRFPSLFHPGRGMSFPCDGKGRVDLDALSPRAKGNYLFARAMIGRDYAVPEVEPRLAH
jgi:hypothetical protein